MEQPLNFILRSWLFFYILLRFTLAGLHFLIYYFPISALYSGRKIFIPGTLSVPAVMTNGSPWI